MPQGDVPAVFQGEGGLRPVQEAGVGKTYPLRLTGAGEPQAVVLKGGPLRQGHPEAGVASQAEVHGPLVPVFHLVGDGQGSALEGVGHPENEPPGVGLEGLLVGGQLQGHPLSGVLRQAEVPVGGDAVDVHVVQLAVQIVAAVRQPGHAGEDVQGPVGPVPGVPLPQILGAVGAQDGLELRPPGRRRHGEMFVLNGMIHARAILSMTSL